MPEVEQKPVTLEDLYRAEGPAELVAGRIVNDMATGALPGDAADNIYSSLRVYAKSTGRGKAVADGKGYAVPTLSSGRQSFTPDASYHTIPRPTRPMRFYEGPPEFAVEVRSEDDYGPAADQEYSEKRADYFEAGTLVVWDVDPETETIRVYRPESPDQPTVFRRGEVADAEPAAPGWRMNVDDVFES